jgi:putative cell wall-binding protein
MRFRQIIAVLATLVIASLLATTPVTSAIASDESDDAGVTASGVTRIGGDDRYAVSAAVSHSAFAPEPQVAFVTSGARFADALSASAAAAAHGPVLLVQRDAVPESVAIELSRLRPQKIIVLGGPDSISAAVETALGTWAPVTRISGSDRYAVSAAVAATVFSGRFVPSIYVASGAGFADALSGSAAVGGEGPILLVHRDGIPALVAAQLDRLETYEIVVLGGTESISAATFESIRALADKVTRVNRIDGPDRYSVSAAVSRFDWKHVDGAETVYIASGSVFPDALSGSAAAITVRAPVLLVTKDTIPLPIGAELDRLDPKRIVVLGGTSTISDAVLAQLTPFIM